MSNIAIDGGQIAALAEKMRSAVAKMQLPEGLSEGGIGAANATGKVDFSQVMRQQLDQVNAMQNHAQQLGERFSLGDSSVHLSDVMLSSQKAGIAVQATVQIRNKLVSAYQDIMNMQV